MIKVENGWVHQNTTMLRLTKAGYRVAGYSDLNRKTGEYAVGYILSNNVTGEVLLDTKDDIELNNFVKLLIGDE